MLPILLFCFFFAGDVVTALFGDKYQASKDFLRMYILRDFFEIFPYLAVLLALGFSKVYMNMHIIGAFVIWLVDFVLVYFFRFAPLITLVGSLFQIFCRVGSFVYIYRKTKINLVPTSILVYVLKILLHCSVVLGLLLLCRDFLPIYSEFLFVVLFGAIYYFMIILSGRILRLDYLESLKLLLKK